MCSADRIQVKKERMCKSFWPMRGMLIRDAWARVSMAKKMKTEELIKQEDVEELYSSAEEEAREHGLADVDMDALDMEEDDMSDAHLKLKLCNAYLLKAPAPSSSSDADADVQSCGALADSSLAARDADEDTVIPSSRRLKTHPSNLRNSRFSSLIGAKLQHQSHPREKMQKSLMMLQDFPCPHIQGQLLLLLHQE